MLSPPPHSINKCLERRQIAVVCADCQRIRGPRQKCSLPSSSACEGICFRLSVHKGALKSSPPSRADARQGFWSVPSCCQESADRPISASASRSAVFPCPCSCLPGSLAPGKGRGEGSQRKSSGNNKTTLRACLSLS